LRVQILRALIAMAVISAVGLTATAWALAALSTNRTITEPPTNNQLIEHIHTQTETRNNDIATQLNDTRHDQTEGEPTP
jgi:hypothetical protein